MILKLDMSSSIPIYLQMRNQIVTGIGKGKIKVGENLPTVRQLAQDAGVNTMTVNKVYQMLKTEGYIEIDRRKGATVCGVGQTDVVFMQKMEAELELLSAQARLKGFEKKEFLDLCEKIFVGMNPVSVEV